MKINYKNFEIELLNDLNDDLDSIIKSEDNTIYFGSEKEDPEYQSRHYIIIKELGVEISKVIIYETNSASGIYEDTSIIEDNKLWILSGNEIYCLEIPTLKLIWKKEFDRITNFSLHKLENDFIIYGELEIFRITKHGEIIWRFGGRDIWVSVDGKNPFNIETDKIRLFDFDSNEYVLDFDGKVIEDNPRVIIAKTKRKWWQIFG